MNLAMEMHDSRVLEITVGADGRGFILFHGYVFRSDGVPGSDKSESGWQDVRMRFTGMTIAGPVCEPDSYVSDGDLTVDRIFFENLIPFTISGNGDICLSMRVSNDFEVRTICATSMSIESEGNFKLEAIWNENGSITRA
jgi:hypothetical protein